MKYTILLPGNPLIQIVNGERVFFCPFCWRGLKHYSQECFHPTSSYLQSIFSADPRTEWVSNLICHVRHNDLHYYNNSVGYNARFHSYESFKQTVNNRIKRRILREICLPRDFKVAFLRLQGNDEATLKLIEKTFPKGSLSDAVNDGGIA